MPQASLSGIELLRRDALWRLHASVVPVDAFDGRRGILVRRAQDASSGALLPRGASRLTRTRVIVLRDRLRCAHA